MAIKETKTKEKYKSKAAMMKHEKSEPKKEQMKEYGMCKTCGKPVKMAKGGVVKKPTCMACGGMTKMAEGGVVKKKTIAKAPSRAEAYKAGVLNDRLGKTKPARATKEGAEYNKEWGPRNAKYALFWESVAKGKFGRGSEADENFVKAGMKRRGK